MENVRLSSTIYRVIGDFLNAATSSLKRFQKGSLELAQFKGPSGLKVLTNEKRGGFKGVAFDRSPFKLFTLRFSNKSVKAIL